MAEQGIKASALRGKCSQIASSHLDHILADILTIFAKKENFCFSIIEQVFKPQRKKPMHIEFFFLKYVQQKISFFYEIKSNQLAFDELSDQGYTSLPKPDESESGQMVLK